MEPLNLKSRLSKYLKNQDLEEILKHLTYFEEHITEKDSARYVKYIYDHQIHNTYFYTNCDGNHLQWYYEWHYDSRLEDYEDLVKNNDLIGKLLNNICDYMSTKSDIEKRLSKYLGEKDLQEILEHLTYFKENLQLTQVEIGFPIKLDIRVKYTYDNNDYLIKFCHQTDKSCPVRDTWQYDSNLETSGLQTKLLDNMCQLFNIIYPIVLERL